MMISAIIGKLKGRLSVSDELSFIRLFQPIEKRRKKKRVKNVQLLEKYANAG